MADIATRHWSDWINILVGFWLFISPWALATTGAGAWNAWVLGAIVALFGFIALSDSRAEWANVAAAVWLFFSPWFLGFAQASAAGAAGAANLTANASAFSGGMAWNCWIFGVIVFFVALAGARTYETHQMATPHHA
jgi:hypothetical protein